MEIDFQLFHRSLQRYMEYKSSVKQPENRNIAHMGKMQSGSLWHEDTIYFIFLFAFEIP